MPRTIAQLTYAGGSGVIDGQRICARSSYDTDLHVPGDCYRARFSITVERTP